MNLDVNKMVRDFRRFRQACLNARRFQPHRKSMRLSRKHRRRVRYWTWVATKWYAKIK